MTRHLLSPQHISKTLALLNLEYLANFQLFPFCPIFGVEFLSCCQQDGLHVWGLFGRSFLVPAFAMSGFQRISETKNVRNIIAFDILFNLAISFETVSIPPITSRLAGPGCWAWCSGERFTIRLIFPQTPNCTAQSLRNVTQSSNGRQLPPLSYGAETKIQCNADINND